MTKKKLFSKILDSLDFNYKLEFNGFGGNGFNGLK